MVSQAEPLSVRKEFIMSQSTLFRRRRPVHRLQRRRPPLCVERLEPRDLLDAGLLGPLVQVSGASPLVDCPAHDPTRPTFPNVETEPQLAVDPTNLLHMVGVWKQDWVDNNVAGGMCLR
jgi:hypothetical protein